MVYTAPKYTCHCIVLINNVSRIMCWIRTKCMLFHSSNRMKKPFPEQELIFSKTNEATIDLVFEIWMYKKLLSDYFPSTNRTLPETQFYTLMIYSKTSN